MLKAVTYGHDGPAWLPGSVQLVAPALADVMVRDGEAELVHGLDTTVARPIVERTR